MHYECFNAHANGAMQWMTSFLPTNLKEGSEGSNHIAISQRVCCTGTYRTNLAMVFSDASSI